MSSISQAIPATAHTSPRSGADFLTSTSHSCQSGRTDHDRVTRQNHVDPQEAVRAHLDLRPRRSLGMHFGTFQLTDEGIDAPVLALRRALAQAGVAQEEFDVLAFGETRAYPAS